MDQLVKADIMRENHPCMGDAKRYKNTPKAAPIWCDNIRTYQATPSTFAAYTLTLTGTNQAKTCLNSLTLDTRA